MAPRVTGDYVVRLAEVRVELSAEDRRFGVTLTSAPRSCLPAAPDGSMGQRQE